MTEPPGKSGAARPRTAPEENRRRPNDSDEALNPLLHPGESARRTPLKDDELLVFGALALAALRGISCPSTGELLALLPHRSSDSTPPGILAKLERAKLIRRFIFQKGRAVEIVATGARTALPTNAAPHWRQRDQSEDASPKAIEPPRILRRHWFRPDELRCAS